MMLGSVLVGTIAGLSAFIIGLMFNMPFWSALLLYPGAGSLAAIAVPVAQLSAGRFRKSAPAPSTSNVFSLDERKPPAKNDFLRPRLSDSDRTSAMRILAVDDDLSVLQLIPGISGQTGFGEVTTVASAPLALNAIARADAGFDCLVLDISLPGMDGIELCAHIRKLPGYSRTPIVMLATTTEMESMGRAIEAGATDYLTKPFAIAELADRLWETRQNVPVRKRNPAKSESPDVAKAEATDGSA